MPKRIEFILSMLLLGAGIACTNNPLNDDHEIGIDRTSITGEVRLADGASPERVFVWMKNLHLSTWTDANGHFRLTLPPDQGSRQGTVQKDTLYFYVANYTIRTAVVSLLEGEFLLLRDDIDANGRLRETVVLQRFMSITTNVAAIPESDSFRVRVTLEADFGCAPVVNPLIRRHDPMLDPEIDTLGAVIFKPIAGGPPIFFRSDPEASGFDNMLPCLGEPVERELKFVPSELALPIGEYEVIPYLWVEPLGVPFSLLEDLGRDMNELSDRYLLKPMRRQGGRFAWVR